MTIKTIHLTDNCDMVYTNEKEIYYFIHSGENDGVSFTLLDFKVSIEDDKYKIDYNPVILTNPFNALVEEIYDEIHEIAQRKFEVYLNMLKGQKMNLDGEQMFFGAIIVAIITVGLAISYDTKLDNKLVTDSLNRGCEVKFNNSRTITEINCIGRKNETANRK